MAVPPKPTGALPEGPEASGAGEGGKQLLSEAACVRLARDVQDICWQALARQQSTINVEEALGFCPRIKDEELRLECQSDIAEAIAHTDKARAIGLCTQIDSIKWRGQCHFGIGLALAETEPAYAMGRCEDAEIFKLFCRHDVVGEIALVNLPAAHEQCQIADEAAKTSELARKTCWHGIGKYLARRDIDEASQACDAATPAWVGTCYHGLGWGAAERDVDATLSWCESSKYPDNCRQGVAHQQKRADPARAVALCQSIQTESIRTRCLDFVTR